MGGNRPPCCPSRAGDSPSSLIRTRVLSTGDVGDHGLLKTCMNFGCRPNLLTRCFTIEIGPPNERLGRQQRGSLSPPPPQSPSTGPFREPPSPPVSVSTRNSTGGDRA